MLRLGGKKLLIDIIERPAAIDVKTKRDLAGVNVVVHRVRKVRIGLRVSSTLTLFVHR